MVPFHYLCFYYPNVKRLFAIVILNIFLLNVLGYYGVLLGLKVNAGKDLSAKLDSNMYDLDSTITFEIPFALPYGTDSKDYERFDGQFDKDGQVYRIVKQRIYQDVLYIVCIKDVASSEINSALTSIAQGFAGQDDGDQNAAPNGLIKDFVNTELSLSNAISGWQSEVVKTSLPAYFFDSYSASIVHPPCRIVLA